MTTLNTALNVNVASAEAARIANAARGAEDVVAAQLRQAALTDSLKPGTTITARYQYRVAEDGSFIPLQTQITADARDDQRELGSRQRNRQQLRDGERQPKFSDLASPKPLLSPTDELALFANTATVAPQPRDAGLPPVVTLTTAAGVTVATAEVVDEEGEIIEAEILTPQTPQNDNKPQAIAPRGAQYAVATLYARNDAILYSAPLAQFAA